MTLAEPVDIRVNPNNSSQFYILWGNGRIDAYGGAVPILDGPRWFDRPDQPVGVALHISNWATATGYVLDKMGGFQPLGGAPQITSASGDTFVNSNGLVYDIRPRYVGWSWNPDGSGQGYAIDGYGELFEFGGAPDAPRQGPRFATWAVRGFAMSWAGGVKKAYTLDGSGAVWTDFSAATPSSGPPYFTGRDVYRFLAVTDWTSGKGYALSGDGAAHAFGGATASGVAGPYRAGRDVARILYVISATDPIRLRQVHSGGEVFEYVNSTPPTVTAGGGRSDVQRVAITGTPTGGTFTLTYSGQTTGTIAYNATAATVQTALRALSNIGSTGVTVTGGPGPGTAWTVTFGGTLATTDVPQMTATSTFTGGTSPTTTVTTTTPGITSSPALTVTATTRPVLSWVYSDPEGDSQAAWQLYVYTQTFATANNMTDPSAWAASALVAESGINPTTRGIESPVDLPNGALRMYVRVQDTAGNWSAWSNFGWTQSITPPATPTGLTATANNTAFTVALSVSATAGAYIRFEWSEDSGTTWTPVRGAEQVTRVATTTATDLDISMGATRQYRAVAYSVSPRTASVASSVATATMTAKVFALTSTANSALGGRFWVQEPVSWSRTAKASVLETAGDQYPTVVSDGRPKARKGTVRVVTLDAAALASLEALVNSDSTLVYRDPRGQVIYCRVVGDWSDVMRGVPTQYQDSADLPMVEVAPPIVSV